MTSARFLPSIVLTAALAAAGAHAAPSYTVDSLGDLGGYKSHPTAINNLGQVVGIASDANGRDHVFLSSGGVMTAVADAWAPNGIDINDAGTIVATTRASTIFYANGSTTVLPRKFHAWGLNNLGQVVGEYDYDAAAIYTAGAPMQRFGVPGRGNSGYAINDNGMVVGAMHGVYTNEAPNTPMFRPISYYGGEVHRLEERGNLGGVAVALNNSGFAVGTSGAHAVMWTPEGKLVDLGAMFAPDSVSWAFGINNYGEVVGAYRSGGGGDNQGFLYSNGIMYGIDQLLPGQDPDYTYIGAAYDINDNHQIVAETYGGWPDNTSHGMLLTLSTPTSPVPEPAAFAMLLPGLGLLVLARNRRRKP